MDELEREQRLTKVEDRAKSNSHRLDILEKRQDDLDELVGIVKVLATRQEAVETDVKEIKHDVKELTSKPGRMWESIVEKVCITIAAALVGFVLAQLGL
jgi:hypothetical protein